MKTYRLSKGWFFVILFLMPLWAGNIGNKPLLPQHNNNVQSLLSHNVLSTDNELFSNLIALINGNSEIIGTEKTDGFNKIKHLLSLAINKIDDKTSNFNQNDDHLLKSNLISNINLRPSNNHIYTYIITSYNVFINMINYLSIIPSINNRDIDRGLLRRIV